MLNRSIKTKLSGFNHYPEFHCQLSRPEKHQDFLPELPSCIARGSGLSYSDAAINEQGVVKEIIIGALESIDARLTESIERVKGGK